MKLEWTAEILRGWPADGALDHVEVVKAGVTVSNGDFVEAQPDGSVAKTSATATARVGLVVRGNGDSWSAAGADGLILSGSQVAQPGIGLPMTLAAAKTVSAASITGQTATAGAPTTIQLTVTGHGWITGNAVFVSGVGISGNTAAYTGTYAITVVDANTITFVTNYLGAASTSSPTAQYYGPTLSGIIAGGKAVVLWGNFIVRTTNFATGAYVPGAAVTVKSGQFALADTAPVFGAAVTAGTAVPQADPVVGHVIRVIPATASDAQAIVVRVR